MAKQALHSMQIHREWSAPFSASTCWWVLPILGRRVVKSCCRHGAEILHLTLGLQAVLQLGQVLRMWTWYAGPAAESIAVSL